MTTMNPDRMKYSFLLHCNGTMECISDWRKTFTSVEQLSKTGIFVVVIVLGVMVKYNIYSSNTIIFQCQNHKSSGHVTP